MRSFKNKVAAITGAGSGIGRALAINLADAGCNLALSDIDAEGLAETARMAKRSRITVTTAVVDVADRDQVETWASTVVIDHGAVNMIFNNAGVAMGGTVEDTSIEDYEWMFGICLWGVIYGTKAFLPHLRVADEGHIVNISSIFGLTSQPSQSAYNAAKFAVRGFTESLRQELDMDGGNVSATCVHPGGIKTNIAKSARVDAASLGRLFGGDGAEKAASADKMFITSPDAAAKTILKGVRRDARRVLIGPDAYVVDAIQRTLPTGYQHVAKRVMKLL